MNKKTWLIIITIIVILIIGVILLFKNNNNTSNNENTYEANKTSTNSILNNNYEKDKDKNNTNEIEKQSNEQNIQNPENIKEEDISIYSTKIYSQDSARQNNIAITCNTLNGTIVKKGSTFSFCQTVGPATSDKGYQKAEIFDNKGRKKKGLGGGNCQISTTLYNAVLAVPSLAVTERHTHSNKVPYIAPGKDSAVAYGSYDLKFVNNSENDIKIYSEATATALSIRLVLLK